MPFVLRRFALTQRASRILYWSTLHGPTQPDVEESLTGHHDEEEEAKDSIASINQGDVYTHDVHYPPFPLTPEQIDERVKSFIDSIDIEAICLLASQHNRQKPCSITGQISRSFNVCFFARFKDGTIWVIRIPLEPVVEDS